MAKRVERRRDPDFITRGPGRLGKDDRDSEEFHLERKALKLFQDAGILAFKSENDQSSADVEVQREDLGRPLIYSVVFVADLTSQHAARYTKHYLDAVQSERKTQYYDEYWLITNRITEDLGGQRGALDPAIRIHTIDELEELLAPFSRKSRSRAKKNARTKVGKAIEANEATLTLAVSGLILQIDSRLDALRGERPNSPDAIAGRDERISDYERMRTELDVIRKLTVQFRKGEVSEKKAVQAFTTFADGVRATWNKHHAQIVLKTYDMGLFATSVGICSLAGAGGKMSVLVSAALVGGKPVAQALKGLLPKRFLAD